MKKSGTEKLLNWDAHYAGIKAMRELQRNSITLEEVALEASRLLFRFVPFTIEEQIPVFIEVENGLKTITASQKKNSLNKQKSC
jgi:hypothetical protein